MISVVSVSETCFIEVVDSAGEYLSEGDAIDVASDYVNNMDDRGEWFLDSVSRVDDSMIQVWFQR